MDGLLHLVQRGGDWAGPQPVQAPHRCTKCNSPPGPRPVYQVRIIRCGTIIIAFGIRVKERTGSSVPTSVKSMVHLCCRTTPVVDQADRLHTAGVVKLALNLRVRRVKKKETKRRSINHVRLTIGLPLYA